MAALTLSLLAAASLGIWVVLTWFHGDFWKARPRLGDSAEGTGDAAVACVVPARNEAATIAATVRSLLGQRHTGRILVIVVDDGSSDGTAAEARLAAAGDTRLIVLEGKPLPAGWTGKMWAVHQGVEEAAWRLPEAEFLLLTDADIVHAGDLLARLEAKAEAEGLDLVSLMVRLRCESLWERLLIPAFVYFFQKLYPFPWVNDPRRRTAAAAGGCMLVRRAALERAGGVAAIRGRVIDDVALAAAIKAARGVLWLGLTEDAESLRAYDSLGEIWRMVARTAFVQLGHSGVLLAGTVAGMALTYLVPPLGLVAGLASAAPWPALMCAAAWVLMARTYLPTLRLYGQKPMFAACLPLAALLYTLMTMDSARRHWRGLGNAWKGRRYERKGGAR